MNIIGILIIGVMLYIIITLSLNIWLSGRFSGIKLHKPYRFINKKSPIYKLVYSDQGMNYSIEKWELNYGDVNENIFLFVIGSGLFKTYCYRCVGALGSYFDRELNELTDLESAYEKIYNSKHNSYSPKKDLVKLNKLFNENYTK